VPAGPAKTITPRRTITNYQANDLINLRYVALRQDRATTPILIRSPVPAPAGMITSFEFGGYDAPGRHRCRAQVTVSRYDPQLATPQAHIRELGTKLGELRLVRHAVGHGVAAAEPDGTGPVDTRIPARAAAGRGRGAPFRPTRGLAVGLWADADVYALPEAVAVTDWAVSSIG